MSIPKTKQLLQKMVDGDIDPSFNETKTTNSLFIHMGKITPAYDTYSWLLSRLELAVDLDRRFQNWMSANCDLNEPVRLALRDFPIHLRRSGLYVSGQGGEAASFEPIDTSDHPSFLSQDILFTAFEVSDQNTEQFAIVAVNQNGKWSRPHLFRIMNDSGEGDRITQYASGIIKGGRIPIWKCYDGTHWKSETKGIQNLEELMISSDMKLVGKGVIVDSIYLFCPYTGEKLSVEWI